MIAADAIACGDIKRKHSGGSSCDSVSVAETDRRRRRPLRHGVCRPSGRLRERNKPLVWRLGCRDTGRYGRAVLGPPSVALRHLPPVSTEALARVQERLAHFIPVAEILKARLQWERAGRRLLLGCHFSSFARPRWCSAARAALTQADRPQPCQRHNAIGHRPQFGISPALAQARGSERGRAGSTTTRHRHPARRSPVCKVRAASSSTVRIPPSTRGRSTAICASRPASPPRARDRDSHHRARDGQPVRMGCA